FKRTGDYEITYDLLPLSITANAEKGVPKEWITEDGTWLTEDFERYARPLIMGENEMSFEGGLPRYARLKKVKFKL
ncbi:MAG: 6-phosphofructokinase, partial [Clostridia bacterium]|nr:6-phosphofructokinase [Clostridia bacterium]